MNKSNVHSRSRFKQMEIPVKFSNGQHCFLDYRPASILKQPKLTRNDINNILKSKYCQDVIEAFQNREKNSVKETNNLSTESAVTKINTVLLCEKYRAKKFHELLSDPRNNKLALTWLVSWNEYIFGEKNNKRQRRNLNSNNTLNSNGVLDKRPEKKILLLNGPPGCGKTTLAHVIAEQVGYCSLEINASDGDEKKADYLMNKITNLFQNNTIDMKKKVSKKLMLSTKPQLLILDECDGLDRHFIEKLTKLLNVNDYSKAKFHSITRPLIFICNDFYSTTSLKPLRGFVELINFYKPTSIVELSSTNLVKRLQHITSRESIKISLNAIKEVIEFYNYDFRSCLNVLQHLKMQPSSTIFDNITPLLQNLEKNEKQNYFQAMEKIIKPSNISDITKNNLEISIDKNLLLMGICDNLPTLKKYDSLGYQLAEGTDILSFFNDNYVMNSNFEYFSLIQLLFKKKVKVEKHRIKVTFPKDMFSLIRSQRQNCGLLVDIVSNANKLYGTLNPFDISLFYRILGLRQNKTLSEISLMLPSDKKAQEKIRKQLIPKNEKMIMYNKTNRDKGVKRNFFGQLISNKENEDLENRKKNEIEITYLYRTGFSNHVKQDMSLQDFLR